MTAPLSTADRLAAYVAAIEQRTGKKVIRALVRGREIVLEFEGCRESANPADLIDP